MSRTYRFIGGPLHGQLKACNAPSLEVPVYGGAGWTPEDANLLRPSFTTVTYRPQLLTAAGLAWCVVMIPTNMSQEEYMRRLADFIEGTDPACYMRGCPCQG